MAGYFFIACDNGDYGEYLAISVSALVRWVLFHHVMVVHRARRHRQSDDENYAVNFFYAVNLEYRVFDRGLTEDERCR